MQKVFGEIKIGKTIHHHSNRADTISLLPVSGFAIANLEWGIPLRLAKYECKVRKALAHVFPGFIGTQTAYNKNKTTTRYGENMQWRSTLSLALNDYGRPRAHFTTSTSSLSLLIVPPPGAFAETEEKRNGSEQVGGAAVTRSNCVLYIRWRLWLFRFRDTAEGAEAFQDRIRRAI